MRRLGFTVLLLAFAAACSSSSPGSSANISTTPPPTPTAQATTTTAPTQPSGSPCLAGDQPFSRAGIISAFGGTSGDATQVSGIRWASHPGCERVVVDLLTADGAPAGAMGPVGVDYDETLGIIHINLPKSVSRTAVADSLIDADLVNRAFVVRTTGGALAVDVHITPGVAVVLRSFEVEAPSRIVVDIKQDADAVPVVGATTSTEIVVLSPLPGAVTGPVVVKGYARAFEAQVVARLHSDRQSPAIDEQVTQATDWTEMWGEFTITFAEPPIQILELFVGSESARNGDLDGVWVRLETSAPDTGDSPDV